MGELITVISACGGVGKSTFGSILGAALSSEQEKTLLLEISDKVSTIDLVCGMRSKTAILNLKDYLMGQNGRVCDFFGQTMLSKNFYIGVSPYGIKCEEFLAALKRVNVLKGFFGKVLLDVDFKDIETLNKIIEISDKVIVVCDVNYVALNVNKMMISRLFERYYKKMKFVLNRVDIAGFDNCYYDNIDDIIDLLGIELLGVVPLERALLNGFYFNRGLSQKLKLVYGCIADRINRKYRPLMVEGG